MNINRTLQHTVGSARRSLPLLPGRPIAALAVICISDLIVGADATVVNVALPTLSDHLGATTTALQWFSDAYILTISGLLLAAGNLSDRFGRRGGLCTGLMVFAIMSVVASQAGTSSALIASRVAMGVGAAVIVPATLSLITNIFAEPAKRAMAIAVWAAMDGAGVAIGPVCGGWLVQHFWWGSIFLVNVPIAVVGIIGALLFVPTSRDPATPPLDFLGLLLSSLGIALLTYTVIEAPNVGWTATRTIGGFVAAAMLLISLGFWERTRRHPMLDLAIYANRRFSGGNLAVSAAFLAAMGYLFLATQYYQFFKLYSPFGTGVRLLPVAGSIFCAGVMAPRLVARLGTTAVAVAGMLATGAGLAIGMVLTTATPYSELVIQMILVGGGLGLTSASATEAIMGSLSVEKAGTGAAANESARTFGITLGIAVVGSVFASIYTGRLNHQSAYSELPADVRSALRDSMASAEAATSQLPPLVAHAVRPAVNSAFFEGLHIGSAVCTGIILVAAAIVALLLPSK